jgi:hypothetical protein
MQIIVIQRATLPFPRKVTGDKGFLRCMHGDF